MTSQSDQFPLFVVHDAETSIAGPAAVSDTIRPHREGAGPGCATLKAFVRS